MRLCSHYTSLFIVTSYYFSKLLLIYLPVQIFRFQAGKQLTMDSWFQGCTASNGFMCGYTASSQMKQQQEQQELHQAYMQMNMEEAYTAEDAAPPLRAGFASSSSSFHSFSDSPDNSALVLATAGTTLCHPEVSSQVPLATDDIFMRQDWHAMGAFKPYVHHLSARKRTAKAGSCGQRMIKTTMEVLTRMHMARLSQYYKMTTEAAARPSGASSNQLQHVMSERKRREKLNDSFRALKTVLPPGSKKDKASTLARAKEYVNTLKSRVCELEERNRLLQSQRDSEEGDDSGEKIEIEISRASEGTPELQEVYLKILVWSSCNVLDALIRILQCLKEKGDVSLMSMNTSTTGLRQASLTLQLKSSNCDDEEYLKESIANAVSDTLRSETGTP